MAVKIQLRRDTAAAWTSANPTLAQGELGLETDTAYYKIGDGATAWNSLAYGSIAGTLVDDSVTTSKILDANVTEAKLAANAVTQVKLADRVVGSAELDNLTLNEQTGTTYTLVLTDAHKLVTLTNASPITLTVPPDSSVAFTIGDQVNIVQLGSGQVTVAAGEGVTLRSQGSKVKLNGIYSAASLIKIGADEWVLVGNTAV